LYFVTVSRLGSALYGTVCGREYRSSRLLESGRWYAIRVNLVADLVTCNDSCMFQPSNTYLRW